MKAMARRMKRIEERLVDPWGMPPAVWVKEDGTEEILIPGDARWPRNMWQEYGMNMNDEGTEP